MIVGFLLRDAAFVFHKPKYITGYLICWMLVLSRNFCYHIGRVNEEKMILSQNENMGESLAGICSVTLNNERNL